MGRAILAGASSSLLVARPLRRWLVCCPAAPRPIRTGSSARGSAAATVCHYAPGGGGLHQRLRPRRRRRGPVHRPKGEGAFLHGVLPMPSWLAVGGDLRGAYAAQEVGDIHGSKHAFFPMQADLQVRGVLAEGFSIYASGGLRGQVRPNQELVPLQNYQPISASRLISREHWLMWQPATQGPYVRAGRFYAPFGLRLAEHLTYVRRDLGFDLLRESYNLSGGFVDGRLGAARHRLCPRLPAPHRQRRVRGRGLSRAPQRGSRTARWRSRRALRRGRGISRLTGGAVGRYYVDLASTLWFLEANLVGLMPEHVPGGLQFVGAAGASFLPLRGCVLTALAERSQNDLRVRNSAWNAWSALIGLVPRAPHRAPAGGPAAAPRGRRPGEDPAAAGALLPVMASRGDDEVPARSPAGAWGSWLPGAGRWRWRLRGAAGRAGQPDLGRRRAHPAGRSATTATGPPPAPPAAWARPSTASTSST